MSDASPDFLLKFLPLFFLLFFAVIWLGVTTLLGFLSGWFALMQQFPDRDEKPLLQLNWQSGMMGSIGVNLRNVLKIGVCPSGLRIGMLRVFGLFAHDFFVPWHSISAAQRDWFLGSMTELSFGKPAVGRLMIYAGAAEQIVKAGQGWPEIARALKTLKP